MKIEIISQSLNEISFVYNGMIWNTNYQGNCIQDKQIDVELEILDALIWNFNVFAFNILDSLKENHLDKKGFYSLIFDILEIDENNLVITKEGDSIMFLEIDGIPENTTGYLKVYFNNFNIYPSNY